jgi:hypothetical protein
LPAFQPLVLRGDGGDGADPDAYVHPKDVPALNEYLPSYPVDMALARYEQLGNPDALRALGVTAAVARPWLISRTRGGVGLAAATLQPKVARVALETRTLAGAMPLISECASPHIVQIPGSLGACDVFFGDAQGFAPVRAVIAPSDSIDPQTAWIDARLAFAESPALAQGIGGALTLSGVAMPVAPASWLLTYVNGTLKAPDGRSLARSGGAFFWLRIPGSVTSVRCAGLCELVAQTSQPPPVPVGLAQPRARALEFRQVAPWLFVVGEGGDSSGLLRLNERYDPAWIAIASRRVLAHVRMDMSVNGWILEPAEGRVILVQVTAVFQLIAEVIGAVCVLWLLKALARAPTKRAS